MAPQGKLTKPELLALLLKLQNKGELSNTKLAWEVKKNECFDKVYSSLAENVNMEPHKCLSWHSRPCNS